MNLSFQSCLCPVALLAGDLHKKWDTWITPHFHIYGGVLFIDWMPSLSADVLSCRRKLRRAWSVNVGEIWKNKQHLDELHQK